MKKLFTQLSWRHKVRQKNIRWYCSSAILFVCFSFSNLASAQTKIWDKTYGGSDQDLLRSAQQTQDGGYILGGNSNSEAGGDKTEGRKGRYDVANYWIVKLKADGTKEWDKTIGGQDRDGLSQVQQTTDGGYILGGSSQSRKSADKSEGNKGPLYTTDYWVVKLDKNGKKIWDKTIGGNQGDGLTSLQQTTDGGYIVGGYSSSPVSGNKTSASKGAADYWLVKLKADGTKEWDKSFGGNADDLLYAVQQTPDGGYLLGGNSISGLSGDKTTAASGGWLVKVNANGTKEWDKTITNFSISSLLLTTDNNYLLGGTSISKATYSDYRVIKLKPNGSTIWGKTISGNNQDHLASVQPTQDGGYLLGGSSNSDAGFDKREKLLSSSIYPDDSPVSDYWIVKLKADGTKEWDKTIGGKYEEQLATAFQSREGQYILAGYSESERNGDKSEFSRGIGDYWVVKLDNNNKVGKEQFITFKTIPNQDLVNSPITLQATATSGLPVSYRVVSGPATVKNKQLTLTGTGNVTIKAQQTGNATYDVAREVFQSFEIIDSPVKQVWNKTYGGVVTITPQMPDSECNDFGTSNFSTMVATPDGGYLLGGSSDSKKGGDKSEDLKGPNRGCAYPFSNGGTLDYWLVKVDANGRRLWDKTYGGDGWEELASIVATPDGGYLLGGVSESGISGDKSEACKSPNNCFDFWLIKIDANGNKLWDKSIPRLGRLRLADLITTLDGGYLMSTSEYSVLKLDGKGNTVWEKTLPGGWFGGFKTLLATPDGGYLLGGDLNSTDPDITNSGEGLDYWLVKLDSKGNKLWDKTYGGNAADGIYDIVATPDGGYLLGGTSSSSISGNKSSVSKGGNDYWIVKIDASGKKLWDKSLGGSSGERLVDMAVTPDGGYLLGGDSQSDISGDKSETRRGKTYENDYWIVKLDGTGQKLWDKTFGGNGTQEQFKALIANPDGSYLLGGTTDSPEGGDRQEPLKGLVDYWVIKIKDKEPPVTTTWNLRYGGTGTDNLTALIATQDGGYLSAGYTNSGANGDKSQPSQGKNDYWIVKSDAAGKKQWDKSYGGSGDDYLNQVIQTMDGGYLLAGSSLSGKSGDKSQASRGGRDYWIVKVDKQGNKEWDKRYGGTGNEELKKVIQLASGRYLLVGNSNSPVSGDKSKASQGDQDYWIVKINSDGQKAWDRCYGGNGEDLAEDAALLPNGDLLVGGSSTSGSGGDHTQGNRGASDYWALRLDGNGIKVWDRTFGGAREDKLMAVGTTTTGNLYLAGTSTSKNSGDKSQTSAGGSDYWFLELNNAGSKLWDKTYGGSKDEELRAVQVTSDGGYLLAGSSTSGVSGDKTQASQGGKDYWVVKIDPAGKVLWDQRQGGSDTEELRAALLTSDNGYLLAGRSNSGVSGDRSQPSQGLTDYWLVKIAAPASSIVATRTVSFTGEPGAELTTVTAYPNPFQQQVTIRFTLPETQIATLCILDGQGKVVATLFQAEAQANQPYQLEWQADKQEAGMYFLHLQTPTGQSTHKLLLSK
ncbi:T9SS type A sorting domain-containing protein [Adhaeribacter swui]|uniref:T9SS type A sorting domain-containing protein n=1 Tax=Adhaeribacter swui TaxID=2086471 RepID=A0A7G7G4Q0_9BACT|nr:T9SS type A sorting domain-containing protein [Adhaeribacter swui]QNF32134.1 T9SS type A sorting domain-containing protein [Adhaeribacter swui]